jgi:hypothetical protein
LWPGEVSDEAVYEELLPAEVVEHVQYVEDVAWVLAIHGGHELAAVELRRGKHRKRDVRGEEILSRSDQRTRFDRKDTTPEHKVDFDLDLRGVVADQELDFVALRVGWERCPIAFGFEPGLHRGEFGRDGLQGGLSVRAMVDVDHSRSSLTTRSMTSGPVTAICSFPRSKCTSSSSAMYRDWLPQTRASSPPKTRPAPTLAASSEWPYPTGPPRAAIAKPYRGGLGSARP